jgi:hypothetical protein
MFLETRDKTYAVASSVIVQWSGEKESWEGQAASAVVLVVLLCFR